MSLEENKTIARRYFGELVSEGDFAFADRYVGPAHVTHFPGMPDGRGPEAEKTLVGLFRAAFPDGKVTVVGQVAEGDRVANQISYTGTHLGDFNGLPPTGKRVVMLGMNVLRIVDGKIVEAWAYPDLMGLMQQLGAIQGPA